MSSFFFFNDCVTTTSPNSTNQAKNSSYPDAYDVSFTDLSLSDQVSLLSSFLLVTET